MANFATSSTLTTCAWAPSLWYTPPKRLSLLKVVPFVTRSPLAHINLTLKTSLSLITILNKILNLPYGSESPFQAEVWFVNQTAKLNLPWGTPHPIQIEDPRYHIIVPVRAHGQYGIRVTNPRVFLETLIGSMGSFTSEQIEQFYKGRIISALNTLLAQQIVNNGVSILDINTLLLTMSDSINEQLNQLLGKYGVSIIEFSIMSVTLPRVLTLPVEMFTKWSVASMYLKPLLITRELAVR